MALFNTVTFVVARVNGGAPSIRFQTGEFSAIARQAGAATGSYDLTLSAGSAADQDQWEVRCTPLCEFPAQATAVPQWVNDTTLRVRTNINGSPADCDFEVTITRAVASGGTANVAAAVPAVAPPPDGFTANSTIYISTTGSDLADGALATPVATLERALELSPGVWRGSSTIQYLPGDYNLPSLQTLLAGAPFGENASPLLISGSYTSVLGDMVVTAQNDADTSGNFAVADVQAGGVIPLLSSTAGSFVAGAAAGQIRYSDPALVGQLAALRVGDLWMVRLGENPGNNGTFPIAAIDDVAGTLDLKNPQGTLPAQIGPGAGDSITVTTNANGERVVRIDDAANLFTTAVVNKYIKLTGCTNTINNGWFPVVLRNAAGQIEIVAPNAVSEVSAFTWEIGEPNSGALYGQRSCELWRLRITTGALAGQARTVRDHGCASKGTTTFVASANFIAGETWTVEDGVAAPVVWRFRKSGIDGLGAVAATDIDFVDNTPTAAQCAAIAMARLNTTSPATFAIRAYASGGNAVLQLENMRLGAVGNTVMADTVVDAGFTLGQFGAGTETSTTRPGFGVPTNTFRVNFRFNATTIGATFVVERPAVRINMNNADGFTEFSGAGIVGFKGIEFINTGAAGTAYFVLWNNLFFNFEGCIIDLRGASMEFAEGAVLRMGDFYPADLWNNQVPNPFYAVNSNARGNGLSVKDCAAMNFAGAVDAGGFISARNYEAINVNTPGARLVLDHADLKRGHVNNTAGQLAFRGTASYFGVVQDQQTMDPNRGMLNFPAGLGNTRSLVAQIELRNGAGDGVRGDQGAMVQLNSSIIGFGNYGTGLRAASLASLQGLSATMPSVTGMGGDLRAADRRAGGRAARTYTNFGATFPVGNEYDRDGGGGRISTPFGQNMSETRTASLTGGAVAQVDIQFSSYMDGAPVEASLNTNGDATATSTPNCAWQGAGLLRVFLDAAPTGTVVVSATATASQTQQLAA